MFITSIFSSTTACWPPWRAAGTLCCLAGSTGSASCSSSPSSSSGPSPPSSSRTSFAAAATRSFSPTSRTRFSPSTYRSCASFGVTATAGRVPAAKSLPTLRLLQTENRVPAQHPSLFPHPPPLLSQPPWTSMSGSGTALHFLRPCARPRSGSSPITSTTSAWSAPQSPRTL